MPVIKDVTVDKDGKEIATFYIEVDQLPAEHRDYEVRGKLEDVLEKTNGIFHSSMELIHDCAEEVVNKLNTLQNIAPAEFAMELSIKFDASLGVAVIAQTSAEAQLQIKMKWNKPAKP